MAADDARATLRRLLSPPRLRAIRHGLLLTAVLNLAWWLVLALPIAGGFAWDTASYWGFPRDDLYAGTASAHGSGTYRYAPLFAQLLAPLSALPFWAFSWLWFWLLAGTYLWLAGRWWLYGLAFLPVILELSLGNIHLLMAAAVVVGFRHPAAWAFILLTKVTPGIGLLWFLVRREWRQLAVAVMATLLLVLVSAIADPGLWVQWLASLSQTRPAGDFSIPIPLPVRLAAAAGLIIWAAPRDHRWALPVAVLLALPTLWVHGLSLLVAVLPLAGAPRWVPALWRGPSRAPAPQALAPEPARSGDALTS
ncbi:MAG TPA: glycosyltransferase family 87 protein [Candidatus Limnocylindrales bacterium]|nr:glycosyltransferase family 87 protein [Candidatus Limnocylindrales bacterium]